jgi:glycosyltransferase involved in cell wall biosynthesis
MTTDRKVKVCQVLYSGLGGHGSVAFSLIAADEAPVFAHSLLFYGIEPVRESYIAEAAERQIPHTGILKKRGPDIGSWIRVYKALKKDRPETILLHSTNLIFPVYWYCRTYKASLIAIEHTSNTVKRKSEHLFSKWCRKYAQKVVLLSEDYRQEYIRQYGPANGDKLVVIGNGIDTGFYAPAAEAQQQERFVISMVARFSEQKDQLTLIKAIQLPGRADVVLKLAGSGDTLETCAAYIRENELEHKVELLGLLDDEQIRALLNETTLYVHSSLGETMPTAILQAMACGLPVIGSDIPGIKNLLENGNGILFEKGNQQELAQLIDELLNNEQRRKILMKNARQKAVTDFSNSYMFQNYRQLIESL